MMVFGSFETFGDEFDGTCFVTTKSPLDDVEVVCAPVAELATAILPVAAPATSIRPFRTVFRILEERGGSEPAVIVKALRNGSDCLFFRRLRELSESAVDFLDVADHAVAHQIGRDAEIDFGALLAPTCTMRPYFFSAATKALPSSMVRVIGFST